MVPSLRARTAVQIAGILSLFLAGCNHTLPLVEPEEMAGTIVSQFPVPDRGCAATPVEPLPKEDAAREFESSLDLQACPGRDPRQDVSVFWGILALRAYPFGEQIAPDGLEYKQLFSLDLDFNIWLCREQNVYLFLDERFWGQKPGRGVTNPSQGVFDFSKREFDLNLGTAWNYAGRWEARLFAYSFNNINRGTSEFKPTGFNDGVGVENRCYIGATYADLGTPEFDLAKATFVSAGYYPTKDMVDGAGLQFKPGLFARAYLTWDLYAEKCYLYADAQMVTERSVSLKLLAMDAGVALRPCAGIPRLEFRLGTEDTYDCYWHDWETSMYAAARYVY